jgi:hypothetical protein
MKRQSLPLLVMIAALIAIQASLPAQAKAASPSPQATASPAPARSPGAVAASPKPAEAKDGKDTTEYPSSFMDYKLGMGLDDVKAALLKDGLLDYNGDPDVTLMPDRKQTLIDVQGPSYIKRASFQFVDDKLYTMVFHLDTTKVDHYSIFTSMSNKYGQPTSLSPKETVWENETVRVSIERPLSVKYIDMKTYKDLIASGAAEKSLRELRRDDFIGSF